MEFIQQILNSSIFSWVVLPILIFMARICDVSLGTLRIIFISRGKKLLASLLGFFEVSIWLLAISQIMQNLDNFICFLAYAGGYAMGNYVGILLEEKLAIGTLIVRIFLIDNETSMKKELSEAGFGVTCIDAHGMNGDVKIIYTVIKRKSLDKAIKIIEKCQSNAFYSIEDAKSVKQGIFPSEKRPIFYPFQAIREKHYTKHGR